MYEWRASFGSGALRTFETFFRNNPDKFPAHEARSAYCADILEDCRLFYENPEKNDQTVRPMRELLLKATTDYAGSYRASISPSSCARALRYTWTLFRAPSMFPECTSPTKTCTRMVR